MSEFYNGMAEVFEVEISKISPEFKLDASESPWDSLAIVSTIALVDDCFGVMLDGKRLAECRTISDIENLIATIKKG